MQNLLVRINENIDILALGAVLGATAAFLLTSV